MKKVLISLVLLAGLAGAVFYFTQKNDVLNTSSQQDDGVSGSWRYKLTVAVETPSGIKTGSAVRQVNARRGGVDLARWGKVVGTSVEGEAVAVDLGEYGYLFALMDSDGSHDLVYQKFEPSYHYRMKDYQILTEEGVKKYSQLYKSVGNEKKQLEPNEFYYPRLVMFKDIKDPKSLEGVMRRKLIGAGRNEKHEVTSDRFKELFGEGVKLREIYIQMTDEPVTSHIVQVLPWLNTMKTSYLSGKKFGSGPELWKQIHRGHFIRGDK